MQPEIEQLMELQIRRRFFIKQANRTTNAAGALVRRALGWRADADEGDREGVKKRAARIVVATFAGKSQRPEDAGIAEALAADLDAVRRTLDPVEGQRHVIELEMKRIVRKLPIEPWRADVRGLGELGLAVILGEVGDPGGYSSRDKLWKRLGLAPFEKDGVTRSGCQWRIKGGLSADDWTAYGYSPHRRAEMHAVVAEPLFRQQTMVDGPYRQLYDRRRAWTAETHPDWTRGHSHNDALRYMTKKLIRDLHREWRRAGVVMPERAKQTVPAVSHLDAAE